MLTIYHDPHDHPDATSPRDPATERTWAPILGPTAIALARHQALAAMSTPTTDTSTADLAADLGVAPSKIGAALARLAMFGLAVEHTAPAVDNEHGPARSWQRWTVYATVPPAPVRRRRQARAA